MRPVASAAAISFHWVAIGRDGLGAEQRVCRAIEVAGQALEEIAAIRRAEGVARLGEIEAIGHEAPPRIVGADAGTLVARNFDDQPLAGFGIGERYQRIGHDLRLAACGLEPFDQQLVAVGIEIEQAAREQRQREDVDEQDPRGERNAARPE